MFAHVYDLIRLFYTIYIYIVRKYYFFARRHKKLLPVDIIYLTIQGGTVKMANLLCGEDLS